MRGHCSFPPEEWHLELYFNEFFVFLCGALPWRELNRNQRLVHSALAQCWHAFDGHVQVLKLKTGF